MPPWAGAWSAAVPFVQTNSVTITGLTPNTALIANGTNTVASVAAVTNGVLVSGAPPTMSATPTVTTLTATGLVTVGSLAFSPDATLDLGASSLRPRDVYVSRSLGIGTGAPAIGAQIALGAGGAYLFTTIPLFVNTAPTISSGFGTSPSIVSSNGTATFRVNVGTGGIATSGVVGMPAAPTGWNCQVTDATTNDATRQTGFTTTTVTVTAAAAWVASDILVFNCVAF